MRNNVNRRKPDWLKIKLPKGQLSVDVKNIVRDHGLHTICTSGMCPNQGECWGCGTATFMIGGDTCTRACKFCNVKTGRPAPLDPQEPENIAQSVKLLKLKHVVITSVDRDDLDDFGAAHWVKVIESIKRENPTVTMEVLIPDFQGDSKLVQQIIEAKPEVISHNLETVRSLSSQIRSRATYDMSLGVIAQIAASGAVSKSGIMLGLGETPDEIRETMDDLRKIGCQVMTIGQYLQPATTNIPVKEYITPEVFETYKQIGLEKGFTHVESGPLVRSSYHAERHVRKNTELS
ncbi:lipoyl synthase [Odoribacter sp. OttesenSCG-928-J03]|nr:lipoyl synthase [Odoribacter sp. OttesenSCG-928-J03]MDL2283419.1 lipoyl synthase [Odoribacter sp. OttesenSCG-928-G04]